MCWTVVIWLAVERCCIHCCTSSNIVRSRCVVDPGLRSEGVAHHGCLHQTLVGQLMR